MGAHLNDKGEFQSDKYPTCPADKVPLSVHDKDAQPLLWAYAELHKSRDHEFAIDLQARLRAVGFDPAYAAKRAFIETYGKKELTASDPLRREAERATGGTHDSPSAALDALVAYMDAVLKR